MTQVGGWGLKRANKKNERERAGSRSRTGGAGDGAGCACGGMGAAGGAGSSLGRGQGRWQRRLRSRHFGRPTPRWRTDPAAVDVVGRHRVAGGARGEGGGADTRGLPRTANVSAAASCEDGGVRAPMTQPGRHHLATQGAQRRGAARALPFPLPLHPPSSGCGRGQQVWHGPAGICQPAHTGANLVNDPRGCRGGGRGRSKDARGGGCEEWVESIMARGARGTGASQRKNRPAAACACGVARRAWALCGGRRAAVTAPTSLC